MIACDEIPAGPTIGLPGDPWAERQVLGVALMNPDHRPRLRWLKPDRFRDPAHAALWAAIQSAGDGDLNEQGPHGQLMRDIIDDNCVNVESVGITEGLIDLHDDTEDKWLYVIVPEAFEPWRAKFGEGTMMVRPESKNGKRMGPTMMVPAATWAACGGPDLTAAAAAPDSIAPAEPGGLPAYVDAADFLAEPMTMEDPIVEGLIRRRETATVVSASKSRKSWTVADLLVSVATGGEWLGLRCRPGRVLLVDCELQPAVLQNRLKAVLDSKGLTLEDVRGRFALTTWRGRTVSLAGLGAYMAAIQPGAFDLIVLDPFYKLYPKDFDENSNSEMAALFGDFQQLAERVGAALVIVAHSPKGDTSSRGVVDLVAGAGSAGRAVDVAVGLRAHEDSEPGRPVIVRETITRSFPDLPPACFRWQHPRWIAADDLDPRKLARPGGKKKPKDAEPTDCWGPDRLAQEILTETPQTRDALLAAAIAAGVPNTNQAERFLRQAEGRGLAFRWKMGKDKRTFFASVEQSTLIEGGEK